MKQNKNFFDQLDSSWGDTIGDVYSSTDINQIILKYKREVDILVSSRMADYDHDDIVRADKVIFKFNDLKDNNSFLGIKGDRMNVWLLPKDIHYQYYLGDELVYEIKQTTDNSLAVFAFNFKIEIRDLKLEFEMNNDYFKYLYKYNGVYYLNDKEDLFEYIEFSNSLKDLLKSKTISNKNLIDLL